MHTRGSDESRCLEVLVCKGVDEGDGPVVPMIVTLTPLPLSGDEGEAKPRVRCEVGATLASVTVPVLNETSPSPNGAQTKMTEGSRIIQMAHIMRRSPIFAAGGRERAICRG